MKSIALLFLCLILTAFRLSAQLSTNNNIDCNYKYQVNGSGQSIAWQPFEIPNRSWKTGSSRLGYEPGDATTPMNVGPAYNMTQNPTNTGLKGNAHSISSGFNSGNPYNIQQAEAQGFTSLTQLNTLAVSKNTADKPQAKAWTYAGKWWSVLATSSGTKIFRLDGTSWTDVLTLTSSTNCKADCWVVGNVTHILLFRGEGGNSYISSVEYDPAAGTYKLWKQRTSKVTLVFEDGTETATLALDGTGRMWIASTDTTNVNVRWSDAPYSTWSAPIKVATGITDDDICSVTTLPGKIGIFWSNENTKRFGFKIHTDGSAPGTWSADEIPASQSALNVGDGMADDHLCLTAASDGTLYCAVKTSYDRAGYPTIALLVRRPAGTWDNLYPVTITEGPEHNGTRPIVILNETLGKVKVIYTALENGGDILYREAFTSNLAFGPPLTLFSGIYNNVTSTHQTYNQEAVVIATSANSPYSAVSVLATDESGSSQVPPSVENINRQSPATETTNTTAVTFRVTFSESVTGVDAADFTATVVSGTISSTLASGAVVQVDNTGIIYDVTVSSISGNGVLRLDLKGSGTGIVDATGNPISGGYTSGQTYTIEQQASTSGFASVTNLASVAISSHTADKPQAKLWTYAGKWWSVLATSAGTKIFRLDGTSWTDVLTLASSTNSKADCRVVGNVTHILLYRGDGSNSYLSSVEYDPNSNTYKLWKQRTSKVTLVFEKGTETATLALDGNGRMWIASADITNVNVRWSDAPYSTWSTPIPIATGIKDDDICAITALPGKIGVIWSNQNTERFGFKTHTDGAAPGTWSADEVPASQSALNIDDGMADDHLNLTVANDGTLYCAVKTSYDSPGYPTIALLVRRPAGTWDNLYPVATEDATRPIVILNEALGRLKVVYTLNDSGGNLLYREAFTSDLSFGAPLTLLEGNYNYATSTHQPYSSEVVILATKQSTSPLQAVSVLGSDYLSAITSSAVSVPPGSNSAKAVSGREENGPKPDFLISPNPFSTHAIASFVLPESGSYTVTLFDTKGAKVSVLRQGKAEAGKPIRFTVNGNNLPKGLYFLNLQTDRSTKSLKLLIDR